jgi:hypothetical protein
VSLINLNSLSVSDSKDECRKCDVLVSTGLMSPNAVHLQNIPHLRILFHFVQQINDGTWVKNGAVLIDLGQHIIPTTSHNDARGEIDGAAHSRGYRVTGDFGHDALKVPGFSQ